MGRKDKVNGEEYICLTDMRHAMDGDFFITDWLYNRNTLEFIGIWEKVYNPHFNYGEFATIRIAEDTYDFLLLCSATLKNWWRCITQHHQSTLSNPILFKL
ncbi:MAG: KilA-N domain-containing protein [Muribaculaceae bacterium]|nr:KilA-N domain-containing protein [Muribaculaceae bacterium]